MDADELDALAVRAEQIGWELRQQRLGLVAAGGATQWESNAATAFGRQVDEVVRRLHLNESRLEQLAAALRRHARHVRTAQQALAELARAESSLMAQVWRAA